MGSIFFFQMFSVNFHEPYMNYIEFKWHVGNKNISNFNTISLTTWFGKGRKNRLLKNCQNCSTGVLTAVEKSWITWCWKGQCFLLTLVGEVGGPLGLPDGPEGTHTAAEVLGARLSETRSSTCFFMVVLNSVIHELFWIIFSKKAQVKTCKLIKLGNSKFGRRHENYFVPFNWV